MKSLLEIQAKLQDIVATRDGAILITAVIALGVLAIVIPIVYLVTVTVGAGKGETNNTVR